MPKDLVLTSSV